MPAHVFLIPKSGQEEEFVVVIDASKADIVRVLLQEDSEGHMRPCAYSARKLKYAETSIVLIIKWHWPC